MTIIHGDALFKIQEFELFDVCVTDPPYCSGGITTASRQGSTYSKYCNDETLGRPSFNGDTRDQRAFTYWLTLIYAQLLDRAKPNAYLYTFIDWRQYGAMADVIQAAGWNWRGTFTWDKGLGSRPPGLGYHRHQSEFCLWATKGAVNKSLGVRAGALQIKIDDGKKYHQTAKPVALIRYLLEPFGPGVHVVDPFAGSGTTGIAAQGLGQKFTGIEINKDILALANERGQAHPQFCIEGGRSA